MAKYEVMEHNDHTYIQRTDDNGQVWAIPMAEDNSDYQRYLRWLENPEADEAQSL